MQSNVFRTPTSETVPAGWPVVDTSQPVVDCTRSYVHPFGEQFIVEVETVD